MQPQVTKRKHPFVALIGVLPPDIHTAFLVANMSLSEDDRQSALG
jgi:hypothetical protein